MVSSTPSAPITALFDYDSLEVVQRTIIQQRTGEIRERLRRSAQDVWEIGQKLADVRSRLKYGQFLAWIKAEFGWSQRTAYNFINVYETFGDRFANLAKVNIATSLLYQLASPSVPEELRAQILRAAEQGETMTAQELRITIQKKKRLKSAAVRPIGSQPKDRFKTHLKTQLEDSGEIVSNAKLGRQIEGGEIITVIPQMANDTSPVHTELEIQPGWYQLQGQHLIFCGDTATQAFIAWAPAAKLAIAITGSDWAHDWLIDQVDNIVILPVSEYSDDKLKQLLILLSKPGDVVTFPWLPNAEIIAIAHALGRTVYAGEADIKKCQQAITRSGLRANPIEPNYVAELVG
jgi:hypothetical protein